MGKHRAAIKDGERILKQNIIAVLKDDDAILYKMLQWDDPWRDHFAVGMYNLYKSVIAFVALTVLQVLTAVFLINSGSIHVMQNGWLIVVVPLLCALASVIEIVAFWTMKPWRYLKMLKTLIFIHRIARRSGRRMGYYKDILRTLSDKASCSDKALSARTLLKFM